MGKRRKKQAVSQAPQGYGFDFGKRPNAAAIADPTFNKALIEAKVVGCAYGMTSAPGFSNLIPILSLVGNEEAPLRQAFEEFRAWGCEEDGDVVDIHLLLANDGTYKIWLGPEGRRLLFRCMPKNDLFEPLILNLSWVKGLDTTNPFLFQLRDYLTGKITPVAITAATISGPPESLDPTKLRDLAGLPKLIKFGLQIILEKDQPEDIRFKPLKTAPSGPGPQTISEAHAVTRDRVFDVTFPVLRERVRRSGLVEIIRGRPNMKDVYEAQVVQAVVNLVVSQELVPGDLHYQNLEGDREQCIWGHIQTRTDLADGNDPVPDLNIDAIARQIELDVRYVLTRRGVATHQMKFASLQQMFIRKGYVA